MLTESQAHSFLINSSKGIFQPSSFSKIGKGGVGKVKSKVSYHVGRGEPKPEAVVTPADQSAAQTRSEVQKDFSSFHGRPGKSEGARSEARANLLNSTGKTVRADSKSSGKGTSVKRRGGGGGQTKSAASAPKKRKKSTGKRKRKRKSFNTLVYQSKTRDIFSANLPKHNV